MKKGLFGFMLILCLFFVSVVFSNNLYAQTLKIGVLVDLSGALSTFGYDIKEGLKLAKTDVENYLKQQGLPSKIEFYIEDTQLNPSVCLAKVQLLKARGINVIIGPIASSEVKNIKNFVNSNRLVIFSYSTAIPSLLGFTSPEQKKYIFRIVPNDSFQGKVIAQIIKEMNIKNILILYREDPWGRGLKNAVLQNFLRDGNKLITAIGYPSTPEPSDWSLYIEKMEKSLSGYSSNDTAVVAIGFEEIATLLSQIKPASSILSFKWFGSDGITNTSKIIQEAKDKAIKVKLYSTIFYSISPSAKRLEQRYGKKLPQYTLNTYDAVWIATVPYAELIAKNKYCPDKYVSNVKKDVIKFNKGEYGITPVTGKIEFNKWNDRAKGNYGIFVVTNSGWTLKGIWNSTTQKIEWLRN